MKVFISWSGTRSMAMAKALRSWLPLVLQELDPYVSDEDIKVGSRWATSVANELSASSFGILCLTPENQDAPWVNFEAGAVAKYLDEARVVPLLLDLRPSELTGPLTQFQACSTDRAGVERLLQSLNNHADRPLESEQLSRLTERMWPDLEQELAEVPDADENQLPPERSEREMLEELLQLARDQRRSEGETALATQRELIYASELRSVFRDLRLLYTATSLVLEGIDRQHQVLTTIAQEDAVRSAMQDLELAAENLRRARSAISTPTAATSEALAMAASVETSLADG